MTYYEYWYNDSRLKNWNPKDFNHKKQNLLQGQLARYRGQKMQFAATSVELEEIIKLREQSHDYWAREIENVTQGVTAGAKIGSGNYSYQDMAMVGTRVSYGSMDSSAVAALAEQLSTDLKTITTTTRNFWNQLMKRLEYVDPAVAEAVLSQAAKGVSAHPEILNEILSHTGRNVEVTMGGLNAQQRSIAAEYLKLNELITLLPTLGSEKVANSVGISQGRLMANILGRIGGHFSHLSEQTAKLANAQGQVIGNKHFIQEVKKTNAKISGKSYTTGDMTVNMRAYDNIELPKTITVTAGEGGSKVIVNDGQVVMTLSGEIPSAPPKKYNVASKPFTLWDTFSLETAINTAISLGGMQKYYFYEVATVDTQPLETGLGETKAGGDASGLATLWHNMVEYAAYAHFVKNVLLQRMDKDINKFYIIGNQVMTPLGVMDYLKSNLNAITVSNIPGRDIFKNLNRNAYWSGTRRFYRHYQALRRSSQVETGLGAVFSNHILMARLNI